jgi:hypothetical protein
MAARAKPAPMQLNTNVPGATSPRPAAKAPVKAKKAKKKLPAAAYARYLRQVKAYDRQKARAWSPDDVMPVCSARAVAEAMRIASGPVLSDQDVLTLHRCAGGSERRPVPIVAALEAILALTGWQLPADIAILGVRLPGGQPHAITVDPAGGWHSWGQPFDPAAWPGLLAEEAW